MEDKRIFLDFTSKDFSDAVICNEENLLHRARFNDVLKIWDTLHMQAIDESNKPLGGHKDIVHNTISIFGSRGAGKTTFLLTLLEHIRSNHDADTLCIEQIDPSLIEPKLHPFVSILAQIHKEVENRENTANCNPRDERYDLIHQYHDAYNQLLKALPCIDGVGLNPYDGWVDIEYVANKGMQRAEVYNELDVLFAKYVKCSLRLTGKKALVIPFDDIDTDFNKGHDILEVIRKYLTNRQIITILTGDLELYGKLVRQASWRCFTPEFLNNEISYTDYDGKDFSSMINQLENQYLVKILKPENRVHLKTIGEYIGEGYTIDVLLKGMDNPAQIKTLYKDLISYAGFNVGNATVTKSLTAFLLNQNLRIQVRLLTCIQRISRSKPQGSNAAISLLSIFWNDLNQIYPSAKELQRDTIMYVPEMLKFLVRTKSLMTATKFLPITQNDVLNNALFSISAFFNKQVGEKSTLVIDYWIRIAMVHAILSNLEDHTDIEKFEQTVESFLNFTQIGSGVELNKATGLAFAYAKAAFIEDPMGESVTPFLSGIMRLPYKQISYNTIPSRLAAMAMLGTIEEGRTETIYASIFKLLSAICDLMTVMLSVKNESAETKLDTFNLQFNRYSQYLSYKQPMNLGKTSQPKEKQDVFGTAEIVTTFDTFDYGFVEGFMKWCRKEVSPSCELLERIFTRFYYTTINIDSQKIYQNAGELLSAHIISLFNAALVEESIDAGIGDITLTNISHINEIYITNLNQHRKTSADKKLAIHDWLIECPLLTLYVKPEILPLLKADSKDINSVINILQRDRLVTKKNKIEEEIKINLNEIESLKPSLDWINDFRQLLSLRDECNMLRNQLMRQKVPADVYDKLKPQYDSIRQEKEQYDQNLAEGLHVPQCNISLDLTSRYDTVESALVQVRSLMAKHNSIIKNLESQFSACTEQLNKLPDVSNPIASTDIKYSAFAELQKFPVL